MERIRTFVFPCVLSCLLGVLLTLGLLRLVPSFGTLIQPNGRYKYENFKSGMILDSATGQCWKPGQQDGELVWVPMPGGPNAANNSTTSNIKELRKRLDAIDTVHQNSPSERANNP